MTNCLRPDLAGIEPYRQQMKRDGQRATKRMGASSRYCVGVRSNCNVPAQSWLASDSVPCCTYPANPAVQADAVIDCVGRGDPHCVGLRRTVRFRAGTAVSTA